MKKLLIFFSFFLFFNASLDESNIDIKLITIDSQTFEISWSVNIKDYDEIILEINLALLKYRFQQCVAKRLLFQVTPDLDASKGYGQGRGSVLVFG